MANDLVLQETSNPTQWAMQAATTPTPAIRRSTRSTRTTSGPAGRLDLLDRRAARARGLAARHRRHDVRPHAVPEHGLRARPRPGRQDRLEVPPAAGSERHRRDVLRHRLPRPRLCRRHAVPAPGRHDAGGARRQDRRGEVERQERRSGQGRDQHRDRAAGEGQGHRRHLGRRVRRARPRHRLQHRRRLAGLARLLDRPGRGDAGRPGEDHRARQADRRQLARSTAGKATSGRSAAAPPGAGTATIPSSTSSTTAPATPRPGTRRSGPATTSTR